MSRRPPSSAVVPSTVPRALRDPMPGQPLLSWPAPQRAQARRCRRAILALRSSLTTLCPLAPALLRDPSLTERIDTTPFDHSAALILATADELLSALDELLD
jgi:hypothetical protein